MKFFPHYIDAASRPTMNMLMNDHGERAYFVWFALLERLTQHYNETGELYIDFNNKEIASKVAAYCRTPTAQFEEFLTYCAGVELIDPELWKTGIIWVTAFRDSLMKAHRKKDKPLKPGEALLVPEKEVLSENAIITAKKIFEFVCTKNSKAGGWSSQKKSLAIKKWAREVERMAKDYSWEDIEDAWAFHLYLQKENPQYAYVILSGEAFRSKIDRMFLHKDYSRFKAGRRGPRFAGAL